MSTWQEEYRAPYGAEARPRFPLQRFLAWLATRLQTESGRWFLWLPVLFGAGILTYFSLMREPGPLLPGLLLLVGLVLVLALRRIPLGLAFACAFLSYGAGFATAKLRTEWVRAPILHHEITSSVGGWIEEIEGRPNGRTRLTLRVIDLSRIKGDAAPYRIRITVARTAAADLSSGEAVSLRARLMPPPEPVSPGGFDFGRKAWFERLGAIGYAVSGVQKMEEPPPPPLTLSAWAAVDRLRQVINRRIAASLPGEEGGLATALITGDRGGVPEEVQQAMRDSGLAHILSISGLHMMLMAGTVFWAVRALLAAVPALALRFPIRKWAAAAALAAALFYLAISGAAVPTVRAWIMMSIVLIAVLLDRPAITMRNVALAALAILIFAPESIFDPSFEMSFAAVIALVAAYEFAATLRRPQLLDDSRFWRLLRTGWLLAFGAAITTIVAGTATSPFAAYHFNRISYYGLAANLIATPIVSLLVMPMALLSLLAMPFGLEHWPLVAMGAGVEAMVEIGRWVASWPGAISIVQDMPSISLAVMSLGGLWLCLWQQAWRMLGALLIAAGLALAGTGGEKPDILVDRDGKLAAIRTGEGRLALPPGTKSGYAVDNWLLADGDPAAAEPFSATKTAAQRPGFRCDAAGCIGTVKGKQLALLYRPSATEEDCERADIVVAPFPIRYPCRHPRYTVDLWDLRDQGAQSFTIESDAIRRRTVAEARGDRPWSAPAPE